MNTRDTIVLVIASAALAVPAVGFAQSYDQGYLQYPAGQPSYEQPGYSRPGDDRPGYDQPRYDQPGYDRPGYGQPGYDRPRGDFGHEHRMHAGIYPQFRQIEQHVQHEIEDGVREDMLMPDDAHEMTGALRRIQYEEAREYKVHGWNLPYVDQYRIESELHQLDRAIDQTRDEP